ncbi:hypothetical protein BH09DEP1_BH09DEP1_6200 [soil metagenome]
MINISKHLLFGSLLFSQISMAMQKTDFKLQEPYFDSKKREYVIEAIDQKKQVIGFARYHPIYAQSGWMLASMEVENDFRKQGIGRKLLAECISRATTSNASQLSWRVLPKAIDMSEEQLVSYYFRMIEKIDPALLKKTTLDYRGPDSYSSTWIVINLE